MPAWLLPAAIAGTGIMNTIMQERNNRMQMELARYKYQKDLEMWNLQNQYNSPAAQMARLAEAGLSPNLVYGGGNVTGNAASTGPEMALPRTAPVEVPNMLGQYLSAKQANAQTEFTKAQENVAVADALNKMASLPGIKADAAVKKATQQFAVKLAETAAINASLDSDKRKKEVALLELETGLKKLELDYRKEGFSSQDAVQWRFLIRQLSEMGLTPTEIREKFDNTGLGKVWQKIINPKD